jgi:hypothetical protein
MPIWPPGLTDAAADRCEDAFTFGCQPADPCWEGIAAGGLGLVAAARGEIERAVDWSPARVLSLACLASPRNAPTGLARPV